MQYYCNFSSILTSQNNISPVYVSYVCAFMAVLTILHYGDPDGVDGLYTGKSKLRYIFSVSHRSKGHLLNRQVQLHCTRICGELAVRLSLTWLDRTHSLVWFPLQDQSQYYAFPSGQNLFFSILLLRTLFVS